MASNTPAPPPDPELISGDPREGGGIYRYRGVTIRGIGKGDHGTILDLPGHPYHNKMKGVAGTWTAIIDAWLDHQRLPAPYVWPVRSSAP